MKSSHVRMCLSVFHFHQENILFHSMNEWKKPPLKKRVRKTRKKKKRASINL